MVGGDTAVVPLKIHEWIQFNPFLLQGVLLSRAEERSIFFIPQRKILNIVNERIHPDKY